MKTHTLAALLATTLLLFGCCPKAQTPQYITTEGTRLIKDGKPYTFMGCNMWYASILGSEGVGGDRERLCHELDQLKELGITDCCRFHITDEPGEEFIPTYLKEKAQAEPYLEGMKMMDALSHFEFYKQGAVDYPVPATNAGDLPLFLESDVPEKWVYYCCGQDKNVSNRFIAMPSSRTRILGVQLFRYKIAGFLQWGFNFYNSVLSRKKIDPFAVTDGGDTFPAGDPFIVYPGEKGQPLESIRYMVFRQGIQDMRALELLEELAGRDTVEAIIAEGLEEELTLTRYPRDNAYLHTLRQRVNAEIEKRM